MLSQLFIKPMMWPRDYTFNPYDLSLQPHPLQLFYKVCQWPQSKGTKGSGCTWGGGAGHWQEKNNLKPQTCPVKTCSMLGPGLIFASL